MSHEELKLRMNVMKEVVSELENTIVNPEARNYLLHMPKNHLRDVEAFLAT
jgi:hypothetical protein